MRSLSIVGGMGARVQRHARHMRRRASLGFVRFRLCEAAVAAIIWASRAMVSAKDFSRGEEKAPAPRRPPKRRREAQRLRTRAGDRHARYFS